jgi:two-component system, LuxR family, response regulator FixJ
MRQPLDNSGVQLRNIKAVVAKSAPYCTPALGGVRASRRKLMKKQGKLSAAGPLVIIVDDDAAVRNSLKFSLEVEGFAVRVYPGAIELLNETELALEGCLVVDQNLSGMSGLDLIALLRARDIAIPAILITSCPTVATRVRAAKSGVPIVEKPFLETSLIDGVRDLFSPARAN